MTMSYSAGMKAERDDTSTKSPTVTLAEDALFNVIVVFLLLSFSSTDSMVMESDERSL